MSATPQSQTMAEHTLRRNTKNALQQKNSLNDFMDFKPNWHAESAQLACTAI
jgi:hypothetical protein